MAFQCVTPAVPSVRQDDDDIRITRWDFDPGAVTRWHRHALPYFVIMLTDGILRIHDGQNVSDVALKAGDSYKRPAGVEHDVMNGGEAPMAFVEIEVKRPGALAFA